MSEEFYSVFGFGRNFLRFCGFAVFSDFLSGFSVSNRPLCPPRQIIDVSNSTKQHAENSGNHTDLCPLKFAVARSNGSSFLLITQYEMPFINKSEATKRSKDRNENGKCTSAMNRRSRVWPVYFIRHHYISLRSQDCRLVIGIVGERRNDVAFCCDPCFCFTKVCVH